MYSTPQSIVYVVTQISEERRSTVCNIIIIQSVVVAAGLLQYAPTRNKLLLYYFPIHKNAIGQGRWDMDYSGTMGTMLNNVLKDK